MRALVAVVVTLSLALAAAPAYAKDKRAAAAAFQRGRALYDAGQFAEALSAFKEGHEAYPLPGFLVNIGQCERQLDRLDEAQSAFEQFLASDSTDERTRAEVREALDEINAEHTRRDAEATARRQRDELEARHPPVVEVAAQPDLRVRAAAPVPVPVAAPAAAVVAVPPVEHADKPKKSKKWVWAIVAVLAAGAAAGAVTAGILETRPAPLHPGSLGLLDGRR